MSFWLQKAAKKLPFEFKSEERDGRIVHYIDVSKLAHTQLQLFIREFQERSKKENAK